MEDNIRPWGKYDILYDGDDCKVKRITVNPNGVLSYQYHFKRSEDWIVVSGDGIVTLNDKLMEVKAGDRIHIPLEEKHRIKGGENGVVFIEVQTGSYFGEDDIVRLDDHYGRV